MINKLNLLSFFAALIPALVGCNSQQEFSELHLTPLSQAERAADFDQLANQIRGLYAPLQYKEARYGYKFDEIVAEQRALALSAQTDNEFFGVIANLVSKFQDGHISVGFSEEITKKGVPLFVTPVDGKVLVGSFKDELKDEGVSRGDEVVTVDGTEPMKYLPLFKRYASFGNDISDEHLIHHLFNRPSYYTGSIKFGDNVELFAQPIKPKVKVVLKKQDGTQYTRDFTWRTKKSRSSTAEFVETLTAKRLYSQSVADFIEKKLNLDDFGKATPFFLNKKTRKKYEFKGVQVDISDKATLEKFELEPEKIQKNVQAYIYRYKGKLIFLIRQAGYTVDDIPNYVKTFQVLLAQNESLADVLVIDQTHNPGGNSDYLEKFTALFATQNFKSYAQFTNADRKWLHEIRQTYDKLKDDEADSEEALRYLQIADAVEQAIDAGSELTKEPYSFTGTNYIRPHKKYTWKKPILVLADELAGSCGDLFPMMMQRNGRAKIFGNRTMGLGGSVEPMEALTFSRAVVKLTRGLLVDYQESGEYKLEDYIENNGVTPDYPHQITVKDFRDQFVGYVEAFSKKAVEQVSE